MGIQHMSRNAIAYVATLFAQTAVVAVYQDANNDIIYAAAVAYALELLPSTVDPSSGTSGMPMQSKGVTAPPAGTTMTTLGCRGWRMA